MYVSKILGSASSIAFRAVLICALVTSQLAAQVAPPQLPTAVNILPPGPTAAALGRYGEIPVGFYTGVPNISIPLGKVTGGQGTVIPIGLNYHASGIRVDDLGSWVGVGWSLDCGGVITRTVHGSADDGPRGYLTKKTGKSIESYLAHTLNPQANYDFQTLATDGKIDLEPDVYSFNFAGHSGQFVFDHDGIPSLIPQQGLSIIQRTDTSGFQITDEMGTVYQFLDAEDSRADYVPNGWRYDPEDYTSSWYLSRVTPVIGPGVKFVYGPQKEIVFPTNVSENKSVLVDFDQTIPSQNGGGIPLGRVTPSKTYTNLTIWTIPLQRIITNNQSIEFISSVQADILGAIRLDAIIFKNAKAETTTKYVLEYAAATESNGRNVLKSVRETSDDNVSKPPHRFIYNGNVPTLYSDAQDHWGYANRSNPSLGRVPTASLTIGGRSQGWTPNVREIVVRGADKTPDALLTQGGVLKTIIYPTGGRTNFEYELNSFGSVGRRLNPMQIITQQKSLLARSAKSNGTDPIDSATFHIATQQVVSFNTTISNGGTTRDLSYATCYVGYSNIKDPKRIYTLQTLTGKGSYPVNLQPGTYRIYAYYEPTRAISPGYTSIVSVYQDSIGTTLNIASGGLRIKRIQSRPDAKATPQIKEYKYTLSNEPLRSSGCSVSGIPIYQYNYDVKTRELVPNSSLSASIEFMNHNTMLTSNGCGQAGFTQGTAVGYSEVAELDGTGGINGKTVYKFSAAQAYPDNGNSNSFPFAPASSYDYRRGKQLQESVYQKKSNRFELLSNTVNTYLLYNSRNLPSSLPPLVKEIVGLKLGRTMDDVADNPTPGGGPSPFSHTPYPDEFDARTYKFTSEFIHPTATRVRRYSSTDTTSYTETYARFRYENLNHFQVTAIEQRINADYLITRIRYPIDFESNDATLSEPSDGIKTLVSKHILAAPIERQDWRRIGADSVLLSAQLVHYAGILPKRIWQLTASAPLASASVVASHIGATGAFIQDPRYRESQVFDQYDQLGNILQQHKSLDIPISYLWGYSNSLPVAEIKNATYTEVQTTLQQQGINIQTLNTDAQLRDALRQLRQQLPSAHIVSYTHKPLIGLTSQTDPSGRTVTYEYDALGRLVRTRDEQRRILAQQQYHYARP